MDGISIANDTLNEQYSLYLPSTFSTAKKWPVLFVFDMMGKSKQAIRIYKEMAEDYGYILATSNSVHDSLSTAKNIVIANKMINDVKSLLPLNNSRVYTSGFSNGAKFAAIIPIFIKDVEGVIAIASGALNSEILNSKKPFHFIGLVGEEDFRFPETMRLEKTLNTLKFPNQMLLFDGGHKWPEKKYLGRALEIFTLSAMAKGYTQADTTFINTAYQEGVNNVNTLIADKRMLRAEDVLTDMIEVFRVHRNIDALKLKKRELKKSKAYRSLRRSRNAVLFKESFIKEDYLYSIDEDASTYNFNNLGWWNYQMSELKKYRESEEVAVQKMGKRLYGYLDALVEDSIAVLKAEKKMDEEGVLFLWMLKTIVAPKDYAYYLNIISLSAKVEDYDTSLFYLEELLKNGYQDVDALYALEHTALIKIAPDYNKIIDTYLKAARYPITE